MSVKERRGMHSMEEKEIENSHLGKEVVVSFTNILGKIIN